MDHGQVVGDEQIGQAPFLLQALHHVDDLDLDGYVEGRNGFITKDTFRIDGQSPGNADALALAAAELMGITLGRFRPHVDLFQ